MNKKLGVLFLVVVLFASSVFGATIIQIRRDTAANWITANPILAQGEMGFELVTGKLKFGDGVTDWNGLAYSSGAGGAGATYTGIYPIVVAADANTISLANDFNQMYCSVFDLNNVSSINYTAIADAPWAVGGVVCF